jgi:hypothetical protein
MIVRLLQNAMGLLLQWCCKQPQRQHAQVVRCRRVIFHIANWRTAHCTFGCWPWMTATTIASTVAKGIPNSSSKPMDFYFCFLAFNGIGIGSVQLPCVISCSLKLECGVWVWSVLGLGALRLPSAGLCVGVCICIGLLSTVDCRKPDFKFKSQKSLHFHFTLYIQCNM